MPLVEVTVAVATAGEGVGRTNETRGLVTALVELGLADVEGVVPRAEGTEVSPGLDRGLTSGRTLMTVEPQVSRADDGLLVRLIVCGENDDCFELSARGPLDAPQEVVADVLDEFAEVLSRPVRPSTREGWAERLSPDAYAVLLSGRSAAAFYGILPAATAASLGDSRRDPIDRAVLVDPHNPAAAWILARRDAARGEPQKARVPLPRGRAGRPTSVALYALDAALGEADKPLVSQARWNELGRLAPTDARFLEPIAAARFRAGQLDDAQDLLDHLPDDLAGEAPIVALRVRMVDAASSEGASDALLARWQDAASGNAEPVRRRIHLAVRGRRYRDALELVPELRHRGAVEEGNRLAVPLAIGAGEIALAEQEALAAGFQQMAETIAARMALASDPPQVDALMGPAFRLVRGEVLLASDPAAALAVADAVLASKRWSLRALALRADALLALGRTEEAALATRRLAWADPNWPGLEAVVQ